MKFPKIYIEITNVCNLRCSFCKGTVREHRFLSIEDFKKYASEAAKFTEHVYLHVMGEPLLHPRLGEIIDAAANLGLKVSITTNGTLLKKRLPLLLEKADRLYKVSISLHSSLVCGEGHAESYISDCAEAAEALGAAGVISVLRLWNGEGNKENEPILAELKAHFTGEWSENRSGKKIGNRVYLEYGKQFTWPALDGSAPYLGEHGYCYAMKDHVAVLCDGSVVPCCLDSDGIMTLGNLGTSPLSEILSTPQAIAIKHGFEAHTFAHPLCRHCGFPSSLSFLVKRK